MQKTEKVDSILHGQSFKNAIEALQKGPSRRIRRRDWKMADGLCIKFGTLGRIVEGQMEPWPMDQRDVEANDWVVDKVSASRDEEKSYQFKVETESGFQVITVPESDLTHQQAEVLLSNLIEHFNSCPGVVQDKFADSIITEAATMADIAMKARQQQQDSKIITPDGVPFTTIIGKA